MSTKNVDMLGRSNIIKADEALKMLLDKLPLKTLKENTVKIEHSLGMVCSRDIISSEDLPSFARSTVDGYAVRAYDTFGASEGMPAYLDLVGEVIMGKEADVRIKKGNACKIPTGGMLPEGSDAVVMFEYAQVIDEKIIEIVKPVAPGENVIQIGEDIKKGDVILSTGHRIRPQDIGACAGIGISSISVFERPKISIISTGDEIIHVESVPVAGQVRDINSYVIAALISRGGGVPVRKGICKDDYSTIRKIIEESARDSDMIIISGGTSVGTKDIIARIIDDLGSPGIIFHGISLKPGKPMIGGIIRGIPIFGLPGHPAAVSVCFDKIILPVLTFLSGERRKDFLPVYRVVKARLSNNVASSQGREDHIRVILEKREDGLWAIPVLGKSGLITTLVKADGIFIIPLNSTGIERGESVDVHLF